MLERTLTGQNAASLTTVATTRSHESGRPYGAVHHFAPTHQWVVPGRSLDVCEVRRRLLHMLPGLLPFVLYCIPHPKPWGPILVNLFLVIAGIVVTTSLLRFAAFARPGETDGRSSILGYAFTVLLALVLFRGHEEIGMMVLTVLALGDGSATLGGISLGGRRLSWNRNKTWTGLTFFLLIGGPLAGLACWCEGQHSLTLTAAMGCGLGTALTSGIAESVPSKFNDNLRVGLTATFTGAFLRLLVIG